MSQLWEKAPRALCETEKNIIGSEIKQAMLLSKLVHEEMINIIVFV